MEQGLNSGKNENSMKIVSINDKISAILKIGKTIVSDVRLES